MNELEQQLIASLRKLNEQHGSEVMRLSAQVESLSGQVVSLVKHVQSLSATAKTLSERLEKLHPT